MRSNTKKIAADKIQDPQPPRSIKEASATYRQNIHINYQRTCACKPNNINCLTAKDWLKSQIGVWQFFYESRDEEAHQKENTRYEGNRNKGRNKIQVSSKFQKCRND